MLRRLLEKLKNVCGQSEFQRVAIRFDPQELVIYNAEVSRGIVHSAEFKERMAVLQKRFDEEMEQYCEKNNLTKIPFILGERTGTICEYQESK
jgi:predicted house-cleaning noncanonical NTP pyrophosphatase (MazG superfamily)